MGRVRENEAMQSGRGKPTTTDMYEEKARVAAVAFAFFDTQRVSPWDAARAYFVREAQEQAVSLGHALVMTPREREWAAIRYRPVRTSS